MTVQTPKQPELKVVKNKGGRPSKEIDYQTFEKLCSLFPTAEEVAGFFNISADTLDKLLKKKYHAGFSSCLDRFSGKGKLSLRRTMWRHAKKSPAVAIFLAKNYLGMSDTPTSSAIQIDALRIIEE